jgi:hypothetical protein
MNALELDPTLTSFTQSIEGRDWWEGMTRELIVPSVKVCGISFLIVFHLVLRLLQLKNQQIFCRFLSQK